MLVLFSVAGLAADAPATVLDHQVRITVDAGKRATQDVTWVVRIDDPAACAAGVLAPPGLDGASDGGAQVLEDLLVVPPETPAGSTFTLAARTTSPPGGQSGVFVSAPDLPTEQAGIVVTVPSGSPLTVWADPGAIPTFDVRAARRVEMRWSALERGELAQAAWSTWTDWLEAGASIGKAVDAKLTDKKTLGRDLAGDVEGLGLAGITERTFEWVALEPEPGSWTEARKAIEIAKARSGTAAERAVVLINLLRISGFDARPGFYRPSRAHGSFPVTVPAPSLLPKPVVVVRRPEGHVYIDPAADRASVPDRPASMLGATVWVPGELPVRLPEVGVVDGNVAINTTLTVSGDGSASWSASVQATGAAQEYLRELLAPLDEGGRAEALTRLLTQGRPGLTRVQVSVTGAEKPTKKLKITVTGHDDHALEAVEYGLRGRIAPTLGPAMAAWLPPRVGILEQVAITPPQTVQILGTSVDPPAYRPEALIGRNLVREGQKAVLSVEVERPYRSTTPAVDSAATAFLAEESKNGVELLLFIAASSTTVNGLREAPELTAADRAVLEALLWYANGDEKKARKALEKAAPVVGFEPLVAGLEKWSDPTDLRPWQGLAEVAAEDEARRMQVAEGLERAGARRDAWMQAGPLAAAADPDVRVRALLMMECLQGPPPDAEVDPEGAALWKPPLELVIGAQQAAAEIPGSTGADPRVVFRLAELSIAEDDLAGAEALLEKVERTALAEAMLAHTAAMSGVPIDEIRERVFAAVGKDPHDPQVQSVASDALARVGDWQGALEHALTAARLAHDDPDLWTLVVQAALAAGDLPTAASAAKHASDLDPENKVRAGQWATMATLALDREEVDAARVRAGMPALGTAWPPSIDDRMAMDEAALLAVLEHGDVQVVGDPRLLAMRAQMRIETRRFDDAARDGLVLAARHGVKDGAALAFAATAGRQYSTSAVRALDDAARTELTAQTTRMEYRLVTGAGDPLEDARRLGDDPRAQALIRSATKPAEAVKGIEGWPEVVPQPVVKPPPDFRANKALSAPGVAGFANPEAAVAFARVGAVTGLVPPPIGLLYSANPQAVERLEQGGQVLRLDGGVIPLYAAVAVDGEQEVWGYGFTVEGAKLALRAATGRW